MPKILKPWNDPIVLEAALEGLELQKSGSRRRFRRFDTAWVSDREHSEPARNGGKKRTLSPEARKRIAAAQKKRWAEYRRNLTHLPIELFDDLRDGPDPATFPCRKIRRARQSLRKAYIVSHEDLRLRQCAQNTY